MQSTDEFMVRHDLSWKTWAFAALALTLGLLGYCVWVAQGPDQTVVFTREARSELDAPLLASKLASVSEWRKWFHTMAKVEVVDSENHVLPKDQQVARTGALLKFYVDGKKGARHRFELIGKITRFEPGKVLEIRILDDSTGKIFRLFDELNWKIELEPQAHGVLVRGTETGHTIQWRSRLFAHIARRVMMHQLFYPDLMVLADPNSGIKLEE